MIEISIKAEELFKVAGFPVTNSLVASWLSILVLVIFAFSLRGKIKLIPESAQNVLEAVIEYFLDLMEQIFGDRERAKKVLPWASTFFIFILLSNWMELVPGFGSIGLNLNHEGYHIFTPLLRAANADLNTTVALAIISILATQIFGIMAAGFFRYFKRFLNFKGPINLFVGILEFFSEMIKIVSFSFRLFGNIFAGEILLLIISVLAPYFAPLPFYALEIFVGFIQALVFTMLTIVFIRLAFLMAEEEH